MEKEKLPIKFFAHREVDESKIEGGGSSDIPNWVLSENELKKRSEELFTSFNQFTKVLETKEQKNSFIPFVFVTKICDDSTSKSRRKDINALFKIRQTSNVIGLSDENQLIVKLDSLADLNSIKSRLQDYRSNNFALSCIEDFWKFIPSIEKGIKETIYKVKLIDFQNYEVNIAAQRFFEMFLNQQNINFKKTFYANQFPVYGIENKFKSLLDGLNDSDIFEILFSIEPMPKYKISLDTLEEKSTIDIIKPIPGHRYETLGILDNGVAKIPHLSPWITKKRWSTYPDSNICSTHGTFVAGIALYGDICENKTWVGHKGIKLFDAAVFPDTSKEDLEEDELIANIREAIESNYDDVKIWNLSISMEKEISNSKFSDFAIALDDLQDKYNILICKSAGNSRNFLNNNPKGRLLEGADSVRSLVVGSVAQAKDENDFAEIDNPSPFSRVGPGPEFIIKPEVSHYGGNAGVDKSGRLVFSGVKSFGKDGKLATGIGTSYSTPRVAALATGLYQELSEEFDPLLLKGLIIHSSSYSENLKIPVHERTNEMGFGIPKNISQILYNDPSEATLILRETLPRKESIDIMDFPMPKSLIRDGYYTGQIIATLVYDPILDSSQGLEYCQSNIDVKFGTYDNKKPRDMTKHNILNPIGRYGTQNLFRDTLYSKRYMRNNQDDFALKERLLIQYADKYYPVKKYAVDLSELSDSNKQKYATAGKNWFLYLRGLFRDYTEEKTAAENIIPSQDFCLIITIRDPDRKANVYDEVTQGLDLNNFWHSNIKIHTNISIPVPKE